MIQNPIKKKWLNMSLKKSDWKSHLKIWLNMSLKNSDVKFHFKKVELTMSLKKTVTENVF